jgi:hypothetical protein
MSSQSREKIFKFQSTPSRKEVYWRKSMHNFSMGAIAKEKSIATY